MKRVPKAQRASVRTSKLVYRMEKEARAIKLDELRQLAEKELPLFDDIFIEGTSDLTRNRAVSPSTLRTTLKRSHTYYSKIGDV